MKWKPGQSGNLNGRPSAAARWKDAIHETITDDDVKKLTRQLIDDALAGEDLAEIRCAWTDEWTCRLYEKHFVDRGVLVTPLVATIEATECAVGRYPPQSGTGIDLIYRDGSKRLVCFD